MEGGGPVKWCYNIVFMFGVEIRMVRYSSQITSQPVIAHHLIPAHTSLPCNLIQASIYTHQHEAHFYGHYIAAT